jgi:Mannosyl-glycoprotein endo-beta-N-acetylglucosaminidase
MRGISLIAARRAAASFAAAATALLVWAVPAGAGDPIAQARARLDQARVEAQEAARRYDETVAERLRTEAEITAVAEAIPKLRAREAQLRVIVADRTAALYRNTDAGTALELNPGDDPADPARRAELTEAATQHDTETVRELRETADQLVQAEAELRFHKAQLDEVLRRLEQEKSDFQRKVGKAERALARAEAVGAMRATGRTPIMGSPVLNAEEIAGWFRSNGGRGRVAGMSIEELATIYVEEGMAAGVRGDIAFAQSIIETGSFGAIGPNNFAGLGACDSCDHMTTFPTARDGVRAQMQHLRNYADASSTADALGQAPSPYWYGGDAATAAANFNGFFAKGWARNWEEMGAGNWATDPGYAGKVLSTYDRMLKYEAE